MRYTVNLQDIENALHELGGIAETRQIQDHILRTHCAGEKPDNYRTERSFRQTIQRKIEDHCPQAAGFNPAKKEEKFIRIDHGSYKLTNGYDAEIFPTIGEISSKYDYIEGATKQILVNSYERNLEARSKCIQYYGYRCQICGFDFEQMYGEIGKSYIQVHHIIPLSEINAEYAVDPVRDLIPVCANCHAMVHRTTPALSIGQIKEALENGSR